VNNLKAEIFTTIANLKSDKYYRAAKAGDEQAAAHLVHNLINPEKAKEIIDSLPEGTNIAPITAIEKVGVNEIPHAMAWILSSYSFQDKFLNVDTSVKQTNKVFHTGASAIDRFLSPPIFEGKIFEGEYYYLVDDVVTTGSSLNEFALYIERNGGIIVGCTCLSASYSRIYGHSSQISMEQDTINEIIRKFDTRELNKILQDYGYQDYKELTNGQGKYIASFKSLDSFREKILRAENERRHRDIQKAFPEWENERGKKKGNRGLKR
jgi:hypothetical protein